MATPLHEFTYEISEFYLYFTRREGIGEEDMIEVFREYKNGISARETNISAKKKNEENYANAMRFAEEKQAIATKRRKDTAEEKRKREEERVEVQRKSEEAQRKREEERVEARRKSEEAQREKEVQRVEAQREKEEAQREKEAQRVEAQREKEAQRVEAQREKEVQRVEAQIKSEKAQREKEAQRVEAQREKEAQRVEAQREKEVQRVEAQIKSEKAQREKEVQRVEAQRRKEVQRVEAQREKEIQRVEAQREKEIQRVEEQRKKVEAQREKEQRVAKMKNEKDVSGAKEAKKMTKESEYDDNYYCFNLNTKQIEKYNNDTGKYWDLYEYICADNYEFALTYYEANKIDLGTINDKRNRVRMQWTEKILKKIKVKREVEKAKDLSKNDASGDCHCYNLITKKIVIYMGSVENLTWDLYEHVCTSSQEEMSNYYKEYGVNIVTSVSNNTGEYEKWKKYSVRGRKKTETDEGVEKAKTMTQTNSDNFHYCYNLTTKYIDIYVGVNSDNKFWDLHEYICASTKLDILVYYEANGINSDTAHKKCLAAYKIWKNTTSERAIKTKKMEDDREGAKKAERTTLNDPKSRYFCYNLNTKQFDVYTGKNEGKVWNLHEYICGSFATDLLMFYMDNDINPTKATVNAKHAKEKWEREHWKKSGGSDDMINAKKAKEMTDDSIDGSHFCWNLTAKQFVVYTGNNMDKSWDLYEHICGDNDKYLLDFYKENNINTRDAIDNIRLAKEEWNKKHGKKSGLGGEDMRSASIAKTMSKNDTKGIQHCWNLDTKRFDIYEGKFNNKFWDLHEHICAASRQTLREFYTLLKKKHDIAEYEASEAMNHWNIEHLEKKNKKKYKGYEPFSGNQYKDTGNPYPGGSSGWSDNPPKPTYSSTYSSYTEKERKKFPNLIRLKLIDRKALWTKWIVAHHPDRNPLYDKAMENLVQTVNAEATERWENKAGTNELRE